MYCRLNEYGSINGQFKIPFNTLNGNFTIEVEDNSESEIEFSVEEYKRPTFYVDYETNKASYRLNDSVTITGYAKTYSGTAAGDAKVKFSVQRSGRFIYDWVWLNGRRPYSRTEEISFGETITDADGKFYVTFKAFADEAINAATEALFDFTINADVTDINGETRTKETTLTVGYKALTITISSPATIEADSLKNILVTTKNLSGEAAPAEVSLKVYALQTPERLIRQRLWQRPDMYVLDKETYLQYFPEDDYADETNYKTWAIKNTVVTATLNTANNTSFPLGASKLKSGYYKIIATAKDKDGNEIKDEKYLVVFSRDALPSPQINFSYTINNYAEPSETANFLTGTAAEKLFVIQHKQTNNKTIHLL